MPPARQDRPKVGIDLTTLLKMSEPLTVHVMRARAGMKETIPLDIREGQVHAGVGWTVADVREIEREVIDVAGGGVYEVQVTDASQPEALSTRWTFIIPPEVYPIKPPRTLPTAANPYPYATQAQIQPQVPMMQPSMQGLGGYAQPMPPMYPPPSWPLYGQPRQTPIATTPDSRNEQLRDELHRRDMASLEERHRHEREMAELKRVVESQRNPQHDAAVDRERMAREAAERVAAEARQAAADALARVERDAAEARAREQREAAERRAEEQLRQLQAQIAEDRRRADEKFNQMMLQMSQLAQAAQQPRGPDPMLMMLIEQQKAAAEAQREIARVQADAQRDTARLQAEVEKEAARAQAEAARAVAEQQKSMISTMQSIMAPHMMSPLDAARMMKEASQGSDQFMRSVVGNVNDLLDIQRNFLSNMMQMTPQSEGVAGRVITAIENAAQTYQQTQAQVETARANAVAAQARAATAWQAPPPVVQPGQPSQAAAVVTPPPAHVPDQLAPAAPVAAPQTDVGLAGPSTVASGRVINGRTDEEWFGVALRDVLRLREGVGSYLAEVASQEVNLKEFPNEPITVVDDKGKVIGVSPALAAKIVIIAANEIRSKNIPGVEAFNYFFAQQMYPALVDVLLPDAPPEFRVDVLRFLNRLLAAEPLVKDGDAPMFGIGKFLEEDGAEDAEDGDDAPAPDEVTVHANGNGVPDAVPPAPVRQPVPARRPRA